MAFFSRLSTKEYYGFRLALRLAESYYDKEPVSLANVSKAENLSMKYLEQLVVPLRKAGWVISERGRKGGYVMIKDPQKTTLKDLIWLIDENPYFTKCSSGTVCRREANCKAKQAWQVLQQSLEQTMQSITFAQLIKATA